MQRHDFELTSEYIQLNQLLKFVGICDSGGAGKALVATGAVTVDGEPELRKTAKVRTGQVVAVGDVTIQVKSRIDASTQ
ncbi:MAG: RNA-binding S4 domain-containing protein [Lysobacterales bacterium]